MPRSGTDRGVKTPQRQAVFAMAFGGMRGDQWSPLRGHARCLRANHPRDSDSMENESKGTVPVTLILAEIIDRIEVGAGYKINIEFKLTARQFLEPDADAVGDQKVS